jgi:hypothetical protein
MKKLNTLLVALLSGIALVGCNEGSSAAQPANLTTNSATLAGEQTSPPQLNIADIKLLFSQLADSKGEINIAAAVNIIQGNDPINYNKIQALPTTGYATALQAQQQLNQTMPEFGSLASTGSQQKYNLALFAAIFLADVTDSSSGSDGTDQLGSITLANTMSNINMVSHRFFGGYRLPSQFYTWSQNPGTFMSILNNSHQLGDSTTVSYNNIHQGAVGDCYFLSTLGALINQRGAAAVLAMINNNNNDYSVNYTNIHSQESAVQVGIVNDLEVATGAYDGSNGNWLTILEQAFGNVLMSNEYSFVYFGQNVPTEGIYSLPTFFDGMVSSVLPIGQYYPAFKFLTGHEVYEFSTDYNNKGDTKFKNVYASDQSGYVNFSTKKVAPADMINIIIQALADKRVIVLGSPLDTKEVAVGSSESGAVLLPPNIVGTHAYAVLGHANGKFTLRNPWGTNYSATGVEGLQNGYNMTDGVFQVPDNQVFKIFTQVDIEQIPVLDTTPEVQNGQVVLKNGAPVYSAATSTLFANFVTSNQSYIKNNLTGSVSNKPTYFNPPTN